MASTSGPAEHSTPTTGLSIPGNLGMPVKSIKELIKLNKEMEWPEGCEKTQSYRDHDTWLFDMLLNSRNEDWRERAVKLQNKFPSRTADGIRTRNAECAKAIIDYQARGLPLAPYMHAWCRLQRLVNENPLYWVDRMRQLRPPPPTHLTPISQPIQAAVTQSNEVESVPESESSNTSPGQHEPAPLSAEKPDSPNKQRKRPAFHPAPGSRTERGTAVRDNESNRYLCGSLINEPIAPNRDGGAPEKTNNKRERSPNSKGRNKSKKIKISPPGRPSKYAIDNEIYNQRLRSQNIMPTKEQLDAGISNPEERSKAFRSSCLSAKGMPLFQKQPEHSVPGDLYAQKSFSQGYPPAMIQPDAVASPGYSQMSYGSTNSESPSSFTSMQYAQTSESPGANMPPGPAGQAWPPQYNPNSQGQPQMEHLGHPFLESELGRHVPQGYLVPQVQAQQPMLVPNQYPQQVPVNMQNSRFYQAQQAIPVLSNENPHMPEDTSILWGRQEQLGFDGHGHGHNSGGYAPPPSHAQLTWYR